MKTSKTSRTPRILRHTNDRPYLAAGLLLLAFAVIGLISLGISRAANNTLAFEAETGTKAGNIAAGPPAGASGNASVKFGANPTPPTPNPNPVPTGCAWPKFPDVSCTGVPAGVTLTPYTGDTTIRDPNIVIDGKEINGCINVFAPGVVIKRSKINCTTANKDGISMLDTKMSDGSIRKSSATIEDTEINCPTPSINGASGTEITLRRVKVQNCSYGLSNLGNMVVEDSLIHQLKSTPSPTTGKPLGQGIKAIGSRPTSLKIAHSTVDATGGGWGIDIGSVSQTAPVVISQNYIKGATWGLACPLNSAYNPVGNIRIIDNRFTSTSPKSDVMLGCADELEVRGNAYFENGQPLP